MKIDLIRHTYTDQSTIGSLAIDGLFTCFVLENPLELNPALGPAHIAIPFGTYKIGIRWSPRFKRQVLEVMDVPNRTCIEFHPGNTNKDTHGCLLPGKSRAKNFVGESMEAFEFLFGRVRAALERGETVELEIQATAADVDFSHSEVKQG